jgi:hypothetical protein
MAHFAELKHITDPTGFTSETHYIVKRVIVVGNDIPAGGSILGNNDMDPEGELWCKENIGGQHWKQTSYNAHFRHRYAGMGMRYNETHNVFHFTQPYNSWTYNTTTHDWDAPIAYPTILSKVIDKGEGDGNEDIKYFIEWSEANQKWIGTHNGVEHEWNPSTLAWDATGG